MSRRLVTIGLFAACLFLAPFARAHAHEPSHIQAAEAYLVSTGAEKTHKQTVDQMMDMQIRQLPQLAPYESTMREFMDKYISWDSLKGELITLYADSFTEQELKELTAFHQTPVGQKAISILPTLLTKSAQMALTRIAAHRRELHEALDAVQKKEEEKKQAETAP